MPQQTNRELAGTGHRVESLGGEELQRWICEANVQEIGGLYYQRTTLPDGKSALIEVKVPRRSSRRACNTYSHAISIY